MRVHSFQNIPKVSYPVQCDLSCIRESICEDLKNAVSRWPLGKDPHLQTNTLETGLLVLQKACCEAPFSAQEDVKSLCDVLVIAFDKHRRPTDALLARKFYADYLLKSDNEQDFEQAFWMILTCVDQAINLDMSSKLTTTLLHLACTILDKLPQGKETDIKVRILDNKVFNYKSSLLCIINLD